MESPPTPAPSRLSSALDLVRRSGPAGALTLIALVLPPIGGMLIFGFLPSLGEYLRSHQGAAVPIYIGFFWVVGGLALLPTYAYSMLGGWTFGLAGGLAAAMTACVGASLICFVLARRVSGQRVAAIIESKPAWKAVYESLLDSGFARATLTIALVRLPPNSPFALGNVVLAAARVPMLPFLLGTTLGLLPRTAAVVYIGAGLTRLDLSRPEEAWMFAAGVAVTLAVVALLTWLGRRALRKGMERRDGEAAGVSPVGDTAAPPAAEAAK